MEKIKRDKLKKDIITFLSPVINESIKSHSKKNYYSILSPDELLFIYEHTYPGHELIPLIKNTEQYCYMSLYGEPISVTKFKSLITKKEYSEDVEEDFIATFEIYFQTTIDAIIQDEKTELLRDDVINLDNLKYLVISRQLKEFNATIKK